MKDEPREILVLHTGVDEYLAKSLVSYLSGKLQGYVVSRRNERWGCNPDLYLNVLTLNNAGENIEIPLWGKSNVIPVSTTPYHKAGNSCYKSQMSKRRYADSQAKEIAQKLSDKL